MKYLVIILTLLSLFFLKVDAQNTIGLLVNEDEALGGYYLFTPNNQSTTFLIDNCGQLINTWTDSDIARLGADQYLTENGDLLIAKSNVDLFEGPSIGAGGAGGVIEVRSWDNELKWQFILRDSLQRQHHDIHMMPNGNILAIVWDRYFLDDIVLNGFDTISHNQTELWPDKIIEIDTASSEVVWEWKAWDHLIQDFDSTKLNYGIVSEHPELIDINYQDYTFDRKDWLHSNAIDYNAELDQILISARNFNEVWIIDHSTTTLEASGHTGGISGKGGDLLYRWGNPVAYNSGTDSDRQLWYQHDASWIEGTNTEFNGMLSIFNNFIDNEYSEGVIINPYINGEYQLDGGRYLPTTFDHIVSHPDREKQFSSAASNFQVLENGYYLLHAGRQGRTLLLNSDLQPVREYLIPLRNGTPVEQGTELDISDNFTFSSRYYPSNFEGFLGKDLTPQGYLELNPNETFCNTTGLEYNKNDQLKIYPNPATDILFVEGYSGVYSITDLLGRQVLSGTVDTQSIPVHMLEKGFYNLMLSANSYSFLIVD